MADNPAGALTAIPFGQLIGAPLQAVIEADAQAAKTSAEFIQAVGLQEDEKGNKKPVYVTFSFKRQGADGKMEEVDIDVPLITIVPIPYISTNHVDIKFKASIKSTSQSEKTDKSSKDMSASLKVGAKFGFGPVSGTADLSASVSSKKDSTATQKSEYSVEYTYDIHVQAARADMPAGMAAVLNILKESIVPPAADAGKSGGKSGEGGDKPGGGAKPGSGEKPGTSK